MNVKVIEAYVRHDDDRGAFMGIVNSGTWVEVNHLRSNAGSVRGNHFHKVLNEIIFLLEGEADVDLVDANDPSDRATVTLRAGQGVEVQPYVVHTVRYRTECLQVSLLDSSFDPDAPDLHAL